MKYRPTAYELWAFAIGAISWADAAGQIPGHLAGLACGDFSLLIPL
jgi:hypothetical protein